MKMSPAAGRDEEHLRVRGRLRRQESLLNIAVGDVVRHRNRTRARLRAVEADGENHGVDAEVEGNDGKNPPLTLTLGAKLRLAKDCGGLLNIHIQAREAQGNPYGLKLGCEKRASLSLSAVWRIWRGDREGVAALDR